MPNRILKESICLSEQIDELSSFEESFFYRLLVNCDDYGCMDAREKVLAAKLYPLRAIKPNEIIKAVKKLAEIGLIMIYETDGRLYLKVIKWSDHQRVRVSKHKYPEPTEEQIAESRGNLRRVAATCGEMQKDAADCGLNPIQSNPNPYTNPNPYPNPKENPTRKREALSFDFDVFWNAYPRKEDRKNASKAFEKINPDEALLEKMIHAINAWKQSDQWKEDGGKYIPYPATWLNNERWKDEIPAKRKKEPERNVIAQQYEQRDYSKVQDDLEAELDREMEEFMRQQGGGS